MANDLGLLSAFYVYNFATIDSAQFTAAARNNQVKELSTIEKESIGFAPPLEDIPDMPYFKVGDSGFLANILVQTHGFNPRKRRKIAEEIFATLKKAEISQLKDDEVLSKKKIKQMKKESNDLAKEKMIKDNLSHIDELEIPIVITKHKAHEQFILMGIDVTHKWYESVIQILNASGITNIGAVRENAVSLVDAMTAILQTPGIVSGASVGTSRDGSGYAISVGRETFLKENKDSKDAEQVQVKGFSMDEGRSEVRNHLDSEITKICEELEFCLRTNDHHEYYGVITKHSSVIRIKELKPKVEAVDGNRDQKGTNAKPVEEYSVHTAVVSIDILLAFSRLLKSITQLTPN